MLVEIILNFKENVYSVYETKKEYETMYKMQMTSNVRWLFIKFIRFSSYIIHATKNANILIVHIYHRIYNTIVLFVKHM